MTSLLSLYHSLTRQLERADWIVPTLARLTFAGVLVVYFLNSGMTKIGDGLSGLWTPSVGAYAQIFPRAMEAAGFDTDGLTVWHRVAVVAGTWSEFVLPILIVLGLLTRLSAAAMIGFVIVQSLTDLYGHGQWTELGGWFDRFANAAILDQRAFWVFILIVLVIKGAGPLSFDRALRTVPLRQGGI